MSETLEDILLKPGDYYQPADIAWMLVASILVMLMIPGIGLVYSGLSRTTSWSMVWMPFITALVVGLVWFLFGFAIAFSPASNAFWGGGDGIAYHKFAIIMPVENGPQIPELLYAFFQGMFAAFTGALVSGATIFKGRTKEFLIFIAIWTVLIYCPIARWTWNPNGWSNTWGTLDFAGGTPVHICAGASALAYSLYFRGRIVRYNKSAPEQVDKVREGDYLDTYPQSIVSIVTGVTMLWIGWMGFNGGSAIGANLRAVSACVSTTLAASSGGVSALLLDLWYYTDRRRQGSIEDDRKKLWELVERVASGVVGGMVAVTPAAGYIYFSWAPLFGAVGGICTYFACFYLSERLFDPLSIFAVHACPGFIGMMLTAFLARSDIARLDGYTTIRGGCNMKDRNCRQLYVQFLDATAGLTYSFFGTLIILALQEAGGRLLGRLFGQRQGKPHYILDFQRPQ